jgi:hypothetical protein
VKLVFTALIIVGVLYGVVQFAQAAHGWFQMSGVVDDTATKELPALIDRVQGGGSTTFDRGGDRYAKMREGILKGAEEAKVPLRRDDLAIGVVDNMLEVRMSWDVPLVVYNGRPYLEIPMSMQRRFLLQKRSGS